METKWNYTSLADAYLKRASYSKEAIDRMLDVASISEGHFACDVGAGVAHLTLELLQRGIKVNAVEPNDAMRKNGIMRTRDNDAVAWFEGTGEDTMQDSDTFDIVTFGSSFNVCDRSEALLESKRILKDNGWFACMWNHRNIDDAIQSEIENIIKGHVSNYSYGTRREDQTDVIDGSSLFSEIQKIEGTVIHDQDVDDCIEAWKSHATLERQAQGDFYKIIECIESYLKGLDRQSIPVPYTTRIWLAQLR